jgi:hypothetical protein
MTNAGRLPGSANPFSNIGRALIAVCAVTVGLFVFAISATFLLFAVLGIAIVGVVALVIFWARARLTGRPFGPREHFEAMLKEMQPEMQAARPSPTDLDGPIIDAHQTPDGWSTDR